MKKKSQAAFGIFLLMGFCLFAESNSVPVIQTTQEEQPANEAASTTPIDESKNLLEVSQWLYSRGEYDMACSFLLRAMEEDEQLDPEVRSDILLYLAKVSKEMRNLSQALIYLKTWKTLYPGSPKQPRVNFLMGRIYRDMKVYDLAKEHFYLALSSVVIVASRTKWDETSGSMEDFAQAAAWELAETEYMNKDWEQAYDIFEKFKTQHPQAEKLIQAALYRQADCLYQMGKQDKALQAYQTALAMGPFHPFAPEGWLRVIDLYGKAGKLEEQTQALEAFIWLIQETRKDEELYWQKRCASILVQFMDEKPEEIQRLLSTMQPQEKSTGNWDGVEDYLKKYTARKGADQIDLSTLADTDDSWVEWYQKVTRQNKELNKSLEALE